VLAAGLTHGGICNSGFSHMSSEQISNKFDLQIIELSTNAFGTDANTRPRNNITITDGLIVQFIFFFANDQNISA
jgi:hypothetical protein